MTPGVDIADRCRIRSDEGSILPFIVLMLPAFIALAGFAFDAGMIFATKRNAFNIAAAAARAGANEIDEASLYQSDPILATTASDRARQFAEAEGATVTGIRQISDTELEVSVSMDIEMILLSVIGVGTQTARATATAEINEGP